MSGQREIPGGVILDHDYADALLAIAARNGYADIDPCTAENEHLHRRLRAKASDVKGTRKALELALLFGTAHLHDCTSIVNPRKLQQEGLIESCLPREKITIDPFPSVPVPDRRERTNVMKPMVIEYLIHRFKDVHSDDRVFQEDSEAEVRQHMQWYVPEFYEFFSHAYAGSIEEGIRKSDLRGVFEILLGEDDPASRLADFLTSYDAKSEISGLEFDMLIMARELAGMISLHDRSAQMQVPFASMRISLSHKEGERTSSLEGTPFKERDREKDALHEAYTLCIVPFREEVRFAPVVTSIDDLLRLREKKEIARFREVLGEWQQAILNREENVQAKIRTDIARANEEMRKLGKWQRVERWLYFIAVPTAFVPELSGVVTIASFAVREHIESTKRLHEWICIGR